MCACKDCIQFREQPACTSLGSIRVVVTLQSLLQTPHRFEGSDLRCRPGRV